MLPGFSVPLKISLKFVVYPETEVVYSLMFHNAC